MLKVSGVFPLIFIELDVIRNLAQGGLVLDGTANLEEAISEPTTGPRFDVIGVVFHHLRDQQNPRVCNSFPFSYQDCIAHSKWGGKVKERTWPETNNLGYFIMSRRYCKYGVALVVEGETEELTNKRRDDWLA